MKIYNPTGFSSNLTGSFSGSVKGIFDGSFTSAATTEISGAFDSVSSSLSSRVASQENFSSSLDNTFATDADLNLVSSSVDSLNAATSSYLQNTTDTLTGDLTVTGTLTAQDLHVQEVTSSIVYSSGSNIFGSQSSDIQQITGSLYLAEGEVGINATANYFSEKLFVGGLTRTLGLHVAQGIGNSNYGLITHNDDLLEISTDSSRVSGTGHIILSPYGNVGIGTTSPSSLLHISGSTPTVRIEGTSTNSAKIDLVGTFTTWSLENQYVNGQTNDMFRLYNSSLGADAITVNRGTNNVGIGITSPAAKLDVNGDVYVRNGSALYIDTLAGYSTGVVTLNTSTNLIIPSGNVGIGTTSPDNKLHVKDGRIEIESDHPGLGQLWIVSSGSADEASMTFFVNGYGHGGLNPSTDDAWVVGSDGAGASNRFWIYDAGSAVRRFNIDPDGNVGIGTSSPDALLQLYTANQKVFELVSTDADGPYAAYKNTSTTLGFIGNAQGITNAGTSNFGIRANSSLVFSSGGANERMRITSSGNVELKPTDPVSMAGADTNYLGFRVTQTNTQSALLGTIYGQGVSGWGGRLVFRTKPDNGTPNDSTNIAMVIDENQDIGIGTTDPFNTYSGVSILGSDASIAQKTTSVSGWTWSQYVNSSGTNNFSAGVNHSVPYWGVKAGAGMDNPHLSVNSDGNVGVGTNNASNDFHVSGESVLQGTNIFGFTGNNYGGNNHSHTFAGYGVPAAGSDRYSSYGFLILNANTNYTGAARKFGITNAFQANKFAILIGSSSLAAPGLTNYGNLETGTTLALTITNSGEVGIGTDSPSVGFHVEQRTLIDSGGSSDIITLQNDNGGFVFGNTTNQASMDLSTNQALRIRQGSDSRIFVNTNGEVILGSSSVSTISTDFIHSIGNINRGSLASGAYARLVMQERTGDWISFVNGTPVHYGTISVNGSGVSYGSNSDYRLKENILDLSSSIDKVKLLKPKTFNFLDRPDNNVTGFLAHEVQEVIPEAVTGQKDGTIITGDVTEDSTGKVLESNIQEPETLEEGTTFTATKTEPKYQQLDPAKLVPVLTGALKELIAKVETLEAEIEALKNA